MLRIQRKVRRLVRRLVTTGVVVVAIVGLAGALPTDLGELIPGGLRADLARLVPDVLTTTGTTPENAVPSQDIAALLDQVTVVAALPEIPGYERGCRTGQACSFGPAWNDPGDHSGCDTRSRILRAQLSEVTIKPGTHGCKVSSGVLADPYTGQIITFGAGSSADVHIDHVFPQARAWDANAWRWDEQRRTAFANDPMNLVAVGADINRQKSDSGLAWLPPNLSYRCAYIARYLTVAATYELVITSRERDIAATECPDPSPMRAS